MKKRDRGGESLPFFNNQKIGPMRLLTVLMLLFLVSACDDSEMGYTVAEKEDYNQYLEVEAKETTSKYFELWNSKIRPDSMQLTSFGIVGGEYNRYFQQTGDIAFLKKAEKSLEKAVEIAAIGKTSYYRALARNYISQHRFREALQLANDAAKIGGGKAETESLLFDVHMELGNYELAEQYLDSIKNMSNFGYMIRLAKWNDYKGNLDTTIKFMEKAKAKAELFKNKELMLWSYTNLADYYGHAGRIKESYEQYLKALAIDENNAYAKRGIAWIVFSHDRNPKEALRILDLITQTSKVPDYFLLKAEIANYMGDESTQKRYLDQYFMLVKNPDYGDMYNVYNLDLFMAETKHYEEAIVLAKKEVVNRPTPESYSWLGYSYLKNGNIKKAVEIMDKEVYGKTFEPKLLYQAAEIYKANGEQDKVNEIKEELMGALYELGPGMEKQIYDL